MGGLGILFFVGLYGLLSLYALVKTPGWCGGWPRWRRCC